LKSCLVFRRNFRWNLYFVEMSENPTQPAPDLPVLPSEVNVNTNNNIGIEKVTELDELRDEAAHQSLTSITDKTEELKLSANKNSFDNDLRSCENQCINEKSLHITADAEMQKSVQCVTGHVEEPVHITPTPSDFDSDDDIADPSFNAETVEETNSDSSASNDDAEEQKSRKRQANPKMWKKNVQKMKRHCGLEYRTKKKIIVAKTIKQPCSDSCKLQCKSKITEQKRQGIHSQFWSSQNSFETRRQFIASNVEQVPLQRCRERTGERSGQRQCMNEYHFEIDGRKVKICKTFFLNTLSISKQTVETALKKKREGGIITPDKRGKHPPSNKISEEVRNSVRDHISKFPAYESHYSREKTKKKYLGNHLNISRMYNLYFEECQEKEVPQGMIAKEWLYTEIFNYEFNYSFKSPDTDTCDICDNFKLQLQESLPETRQNIQTQYDEHLNDASNRYKLKSEDKKKSREYTNQKVVMIDLQKCLPTPDLQNSQSFYSLKLWTYNLTIHDATLQNSFCMMWDESISGRGGNEVASCIVKWVIENVGDNINNLTLWSDNCPSQNRNMLVVMCYFWMINLKPNLQVITHNFLARGHTHLEADTVHSVIERERKKIPQFQIMTPWDWQQLVRLCGSKKQLNVVSMETEDFKNFGSMYEGPNAIYVLRKKSESGTDFLISNAVQLQIRRESPGMLFYKTNFNEEYFVVDLNRKTRRSLNMLNELPCPRNEPKPISSKKYEHLQKLLRWVPSRFHNFYKSLKQEKGNSLNESENF